MRHTAVVARVVLAILLATAVAGAQTLPAQLPGRRPDNTPSTESEPRVINLADAGERDTSRVAPGRYSISLTNAVPTARYTVRVGVEAIPIPALPDFPRHPGEDIVSDLCKPVNRAVDALRNVTRERDVQRARDAYLDARNASGVEAGCQSDVVGGDSLERRTTIAAGEWVVRQGYALVVRIARLNADGAPLQSWEVVYTTGARGEWRVSYGFAFPILRGIAENGTFGDQERFIAEEVGEKQFVVTRTRPTRQFDALPVVFYSFMPPQDAGFRWNPLTAGLGLDLTNPVILLGTGITFNANVQVSGGFGARQERALLGRYSAGDTVATNLTEDQLTEEVFRIRPFVSVSLRFGTNPFSTGGTKSPPEDRSPPGDKPRMSETTGGTGGATAPVSHE